MFKSLLRVCLLSALLEIGSCAVPEDISNYQNEYVCSTDVRLVRCPTSPRKTLVRRRTECRPLSIGDVEEAVKRHAQVKAVGAGHSWNKVRALSSQLEREPSVSLAALLRFISFCGSRFV